MNSKITLINDTPIYAMYFGDKPIYNMYGDILTKLSQLNVTENGIYIAANDGYDGYSEVLVNVEGLDFSSIGYDKELSDKINNEFIAPLKYSKKLLDEWDSSTTSTSSLYRNDIQLVYAPNIDTSNVTNMTSMFYGCSSLQTIPHFNTSNVVNMQNMFDGCTSLQTIPHFNTSNVVNMQNMFDTCSKLTTIPLFDTSKVTSMSNMFYYCVSLQSIPLLDTSNVTTMGNMFNGCSKLTTLPLLDTSNVTSMSSMFYNCRTIQTIPELNTNKVTDMSSMFNGCSNLQSLPLLDCGNVTSMNRIFGTSNITTLTNLGGFKDLKISITSYFLDKAPNLTTESLMNVINNLFDLTANGLSGQSLKFGSTNINKLTAEQIAVVTAKGWTLIA